MREIEVPRDREAAYVDALISQWNEHQGGALLPADVRLESVVAANGHAEIVVSQRGARFGATIEIPLDTPQTAWEPDANTPDHWALWDVIVPIVEEIETGAEARIAPDAQGVRRI